MPLARWTVWKESETWLTSLQSKLAKLLGPKSPNQNVWCNTTWNHGISSLLLPFQSKFVGIIYQNCTDNYQSNCTTTWNHAISPPSLLKHICWYYLPKMQSTKQHAKTMLYNSHLVFFMLTSELLHNYIMHKKNLYVVSLLSFRRVSLLCWFVHSSAHEWWIFLAKAQCILLVAQYFCKFFKSSAFLYLF